MFGFQLETASSVKIFVNDKVRPSRKNRWHDSDRVSMFFLERSIDALSKHSSSWSGRTGTTHRTFDIFSSKVDSLSWGNSGSAPFSNVSSNVSDVLGKDVMFYMKDEFKLEFKKQSGDSGEVPVFRMFPQISPDLS